MPQEWQAMFNICRKRRNKLRNRLILSLLYCSFRVSDMLRIRVENILWERNEIIVAAKTTRRRKGKDKKTEGRKQILVLIDNQTKELLADYIKEENIRRNGMLFNITRVRVWQIVKELASDAGLERVDFLSPHKLRHGCAVDLIQQEHKLFSGKADLKHVGDQLGHTDIRYTAQYLQFTTGNRRKAFGIE